MNKIGVSLGASSQTPEVYEKCKKAGIDCVEVSTGYIPDVSALDFNTVKKNADDAGIELWSYHLPFGPFEELDISSCDASFRKNSINYSAECIKKAADIGIKTFVIHPSGEPIQDGERSERIKCSQQSLAALAEIAASYGGVLAVEDLPRSCLGRDSAEILELLEADKRLRICFDTNHLLYENCVDFVKKVGGKIITTHVSDCDFVNERHWLCGEGKVDWKALYSVLKEVKYAGPWLYEIGLWTPGTIVRPRHLVYEDFVKNANEIFEGKELTVLGTPKENLGMWG